MNQKMEFKQCPNCNKKFTGLLSNKYIASQDATDFINMFAEIKFEAYCSGCAPDLINKYRNKIIEDKESLTVKLKDIIDIIPIITINSPNKWDYSIIEIVSAQSVTGTGIFSEISSSFSDFFGSQSDSLANKIAGGEKLCKAQLRYKAAILGGNAVVATDIDYAEVGGSKGMLMVCMAGTAVKIENIESVFGDKTNKLETLMKYMSELGYLSDIKTTFDEFY